MGQFLAIAAIASSIGQGVLAAKAAKQQAQAISDAAEYNAVRAEQEGQAKQSRLRRQARRKLSSQRVKFAKAGVRIEGSPLDLLAQNAAEFELDALDARIAATNTSVLENKRAHEARKAGKTAVGAALLKGLAGGAGAAQSVV